MGRIVVETRITNLFDEDKSIRCGMLVDTGAGALILPAAWKERLGRIQAIRDGFASARQPGCSRRGGMLARRNRDRRVPPGCPNEVIFVEMEGEDDDGYEPLLGYVILEQAQAAVDLVAHRLVPVRYIDMK